MSVLCVCSPDSHCPDKPVYNRCHIFFNYKLFVPLCPLGLIK